MPGAVRLDRLEESIFRDLRGRILRGELQPGQRLPPERELATALSTNRNTLREAIRRLEAAGLVTVRHGQGVTVSDFRRSGNLSILEAFLEETGDPREKGRVLQDLLQVRSEVIGFAVALAVRRAAPLDLDRLMAIGATLRQAFEAGDGLAVALAYQDWLEALVEASHSLPARWIANPFFSLHQRLVRRFPGLAVLEPSLPLYLDEFLDAFARRDVDRCTSSTREYLRRVDESLAVRVAGMVTAEPSRTGSWKEDRP